MNALIKLREWGLYSINSVDSRGYKLINKNGNGFYVYKDSVVSTFNYKITLEEIKRDHPELFL